MIEIYIYNLFNNNLESEVINPLCLSMITFTFTCLIHYSSMILKLDLCHYYTCYFFMKCLYLSYHTVENQVHVHLQLILYMTKKIGVVVEYTQIHVKINTKLTNLKK